MKPLRPQIAETKYTYIPSYHTKQGSPTCLMLRLQGSKRWRRLMYSPSNLEFVRIKGIPYLVTLTEE